LFCIRHFASALKSAKPSLRLPPLIRHFALANAFAKGECGVFANSLKRIGKWQGLACAFAKGECGVFANSLQRIGKWRMMSECGASLKRNGECVLLAKRIGE
jgi:hypothetical protein